MIKLTPEQQTTINGLFSATRDEVVAYYEEHSREFPYRIRFLIRTIVGTKTIYSDGPAPENRKKPSYKEPVDATVANLFKDLPVENCVEFYRMQHDNLNGKTRYALREIIGAKVIYGEDYGKQPTAEQAS